MPFMETLRRTKVKRVPSDSHPQISLAFILYYWPNRSAQLYGSQTVLVFLFCINGLLNRPLATIQRVIQKVTTKDMNKWRGLQEFLNKAQKRRNLVIREG